MLPLISKAYAYINFPSVPLLPSDLGLTEVITRIVTWLMVLAGFVAVIYLIYGGLLYITAGGDAEKAKSGRAALINAIIGIVIIALALLIVRWVGSILQTSSAG